MVGMCMNYWTWWPIRCLMSGSFMYLWPKVLISGRSLLYSFRNKYFVLLIWIHQIRWRIWAHNLKKQYLYDIYTVMDGSMYDVLCYRTSMRTSIFTRSNDKQETRTPRGCNMYNPSSILLVLFILVMLVFSEPFYLSHAGGSYTRWARGVTQERYFIIQPSWMREWGPDWGLTITF